MWNAPEPGRHRQLRPELRRDPGLDQERPADPAAVPSGRPGAVLRRHPDTHPDELADRHDRLRRPRPTSGSGRSTSTSSSAAASTTATRRSTAYGTNNTWAANTFGTGKITPAASLTGTPRPYMAYDDCPVHPRLHTWFGPLTMLGLPGRQLEQPGLQLVRRDDLRGPDAGSSRPASSPPSTTSRRTTRTTWPA